MTMNITYIYEILIRQRNNNKKTQNPTDDELIVTKSANTK